MSRNPIRTRTNKSSLLAAFIKRKFKRKERKDEDAKHAKGM